MKTYSMLQMKDKEIDQQEPVGQKQKKNQNYIHSNQVLSSFNRFLPSLPGT